MATPSARIQLLSRYQIIGPGLLRASGSYTLYGLAFLSAGLAMEAMPAAQYMRGRWIDPLWVLVAFGSLFLLVGAWIAGLRENLDVNPTSICDVLKTWTSTTKTRVERSRLKAVRLLVQVTATSQNRRTTYYIAGLVIDDPAFSAPLQVVAKRSEAGARRAAIEISECLKVEFQDAIGDEIITVDPFATEDAHVLGADVAVGLPKPVGITVGQTTEGAEVWSRGTLRPGAPALAIGVGVMISLGAIAAAAAAASMTSRTSSLVPIFMGAVVGLPGMFFTTWGLLSIVSRERIAVQGNDLVRELYVGGLRYGRRSFPRKMIAPLRTQTRSADGYGLAIVVDNHRVLVGRGLDKDGLKWLHAWLDGQL